MPDFRVILASVPWTNSWLQLALAATFLSGGLVLFDLSHGGGSGTSPSSNSSPGSNSNQNAPPPPAPSPAPANLPPQDAHAFTNKLGMKFVPAGTSGVLFSIWDTRVEDFQQFVTATGYNATGGMYTIARDMKWYQNGATWQQPGFQPQQNDSPVVGVSYADAVAFCQWLTTMERQSGSISGSQEYRLPTDAEWTTAAGATVYPWGNQYPPTPTQGNYFRKGDGWNADEIPDSDGYMFTSPVGSFQPNGYGLYDMGGDVLQWVSDWYTNSMNPPEAVTQFSLGDDGNGTIYHPLRGGSWYHCRELAVRTAYHERYTPDSRYENVGFRCVLTRPSSSSWTTYLLIGAGLIVFAVGCLFFMSSKSKSGPDAAQTA